MDGYNEIVNGKFLNAMKRIEERFFTGKGKKAFPPLVFAVNTRCSKHVIAFVQSKGLYDTKLNTTVQYLAVNPDYTGRDAGEVLATLCHELCHVYEEAYIHIPRGGYHDRQWAELMADCGLEPVYNNTSRTSVHHKVVEGGEFQKFIGDFTAEFGADYFTLQSYANYLVTTGGKPAVAEGEGADNADKPVKKYNRNKIKYVCQDCGAKVWGKAGLRLMCVECSCEYEAEEAGDGEGSSGEGTDD